MQIVGIPKRFDNPIGSSNKEKIAEEEKD